MTLEMEENMNSDPIERAYYAFFASRSRDLHPPRWNDVPQWAREFAEFVQQTSHLDVAIQEDKSLIPVRHEMK